MEIFGIDIVLLLGIVNIFLMTFILLTGLRVIKLKHYFHKITAIVFAIFVITHAFIAIFFY